MSNALIAWKDSYNLGLEEIDDQHKSLIDIINRIWISVVAKKDKDAVFPLIEELERYTIAHFAAEETFMRVTEYPDFPAHKLAHQDFIARVATEKTRALQSGSLSLELIYFLRDWLINHILVTDRQYADFTQKSKHGQPSLLGRIFKRFF